VDALTPEQQEEYFAHEIEELIAFIFMNNGKEVDLRQ